MSTSGKTRFLGLRGTLAFVLAGTFWGHLTQAADITWGGEYRFEAVKVQDPELNGDANSNKAYFLHHLILDPKIIAGDGLTIYGRLDVLNSPTYGIDANGEVQSVAGDVLGNGPGKGFSNQVSSSTNGSDSNTFGRTERAGGIAVTELYATWTQEFGQLIVGRVPMQFGLGTALNAGNGLFDHYIDTKDIVGYKIVLGNFFILPMLGKVNEGDVGTEDDVNDYMVQAEYDNPETDLSIGAFYQMRVSTFAGNDAPAGTLLGGTASATDAPTRVDGGKTNLIAVFSRQKVSSFTIGIEADILSGSTGIATSASNGQGVNLNAYGIAGEIGWKPDNSKLSGVFKLGIASGDDPGTDDTYEGYSFSRNYDVAMLLFNHPLGQHDYLRTGLVNGNTTNAPYATTNPANQIDTEAISNTIYFAPSLTYQAHDNLSYGGAFIYGILNKDPLGPGAGTPSGLGYEVDANITYKPMPRLTWVSEAGVFVPGAAWSGRRVAYGLQTRAAITF